MSCKPKHILLLCTVSFMFIVSSFCCRQINSNFIKSRSVFLDLDLTQVLLNLGLKIFVIRANKSWLTILLNLSDPFYDALHLGWIGIYKYANVLSIKYKVQRHYELDF